MAENVRATLAFVARGETPVGIVYETDAKVEPAVKSIGVFPESSHPPVVYPVAATAASTNAEVTSYLNFLHTLPAKAIFERYGFSYLIKPTS
jgi:molybdate transport system substrate-binding protein